MISLEHHIWGLLFLLVYETLVVLIVVLHEVHIIVIIWVKALILCVLEHLLLQIVHLVAVWHLTVLLVIITHTIVHIVLHVCWTETIEVEIVCVWLAVEEWLLLLALEVLLRVPLLWLPGLVWLHCTVWTLLLGYDLLLLGHSLILNRHIDLVLSLRHINLVLLYSEPNNVDWDLGLILSLWLLCWLLLLGKASAKDVLQILHHVLALIFNLCWLDLR